MRRTEDFFYRIDSSKSNLKLVVSAVTPDTIRVACILDLKDKKLLENLKESIQGGTGVVNAVCKNSNCNLFFWTAAVTSSILIIFLFDAAAILFVSFESKITNSSVAFEIATNVSYGRILKLR